MKHKKVKPMQENKKHQISKIEKDMFSMSFRAHGKNGETVNWSLLSSLFTKY